ncbi:MAG: hypothetical protein NT175_14125 [Bacteroidetes bacterium]|nr:hypothetical protein [Bacteroidota bacterium]
MREPRTITAILLPGFPKDLDSARNLASEQTHGRFKFEEWVVEVMLHGVLNQTKTTIGFDGYRTFDVQGFLSNLQKKGYPHKKTTQNKAPGCTISGKEVIDTIQE